MNINKEKIQKACALFHTCFEDEANDYSEREDSDVEYFVGVIMYNLFGFSKAIPTMKTMDVGADFIQASNKTYVEVLELIDTIKSDDELELLTLLQNHIDNSIEKYNHDSMDCYLLNRLKNHIKTLEGIYAGTIKVDNVNFKNEAQKK